MLILSKNYVFSSSHFLSTMLTSHSQLSGGHHNPCYEVLYCMGGSEHPTASDNDAGGFESKFSIFYTADLDQPWLQGFVWRRIAHGNQVQIFFAGWNNLSKKTYEEKYESRTIRHMTIRNEDFSDNSTSKKKTENPTLAENLTSIFTKNQMFGLKSHFILY